MEAAGRGRGDEKRYFKPAESPTETLATQATTNLIESKTSYSG